MIKIMKRFTSFKESACIFFLCYLLSVNIHAQSLAGITNKPDTSYTNYSAYAYEKRYHPDIKIVTAFNFADVDIKKNITYCSIRDRKLMIDAFMPKQSISKRTAVIMIHG